MKNYIFFTHEGFTKCPTKDGHDGEEEDCENCQVLGTACGESVPEAWENCLKDNPWIKDYGFGREGVYAYEIVGDQLLVV